MRVFFAFFSFFLLAACGTDKFTNTDGSAPDGSTDGGGPEAGCSDGTREGFVDRATFPKIAACGGGFQIAGTATMASMSPTCGRQGGNNGALPNGPGCTVEDLCQAGWHVCRNATDVRTNLPITSPTCAVPEMMPQGFYLTRQTTNLAFVCANFDMPNNVVGCGNVPIRGADPSCAPLTNTMTVMECNTAPWSCNGMMADAEGATIAKFAPANGGVMCCLGT